MDSFACSVGMKKEGRSFSQFSLGVHFSFHIAFYPFPALSCLSLLMSLSLTSPSTLLSLPFSLCILLPRGSAVVFFCRTSVHKAKESPGQLSVYKALCHVNKDKQSLFLRTQIWNSNNTIHLSDLKPAISAIRKLCCLICTSVKCLLLWPGQLKGLFPTQNNWFNKLPAVFHSEEVKTAKLGDGAERLIRKKVIFIKCIALWKPFF